MPAKEVAGRYRFHRRLSVHGAEGWEARQHHMHHWIDHMVRYLSFPGHQTWEHLPPNPDIQSGDLSRLLTSGGHHFRLVQTC